MTDEDLCTSSWIEPDFEATTKGTGEIETIHDCSRHGFTSNSAA